MAATQNPCNFHRGHAAVTELSSVLFFEASSATTNEKKELQITHNERCCYSKACHGCFPSVTFDPLQPQLIGGAPCG